MHWTQTAAGRKKLSRIHKERWERKNGASDSSPPAIDNEVDRMKTVLQLFKALPEHAKEYVRKRLPFLVLLLLAAAGTAQADTLFTNVGPPGAASYTTNYDVVAGWSDTVFYTVSTLFTTNRDSSGPVDLFLSIFAFSTGVDPTGLDNNNFPAFILSLTAGAADEIWRSQPFYPSLLVSNYDPTRVCCSLFHVRTGNVKLHPGTPYVLTAIPWQTNTTDFWFLNDQGQPGLVVTSRSGGPTRFANTLATTAEPIPEPGTLALLAAGLLGLVALSWRKS